MCFKALVLFAPFSRYYSPKTAHVNVCYLLLLSRPPSSIWPQPVDLTRQTSTWRLTSTRVVSFSRSFTWSRAISRSPELCTYIDTARDTVVAPFNHLVKCPPFLPVFLYDDQYPSSFNTSQLKHWMRPYEHLFDMCTGRQACCIRVSVSVASRRLQRFWQLMASAQQASTVYGPPLLLALVCVVFVWNAKATGLRRLTPLSSHWFVGKRTTRIAQH